jgi:hypothetical protein
MHMQGVEHTAAGAKIDEPERTAPTQAVQESESSQADALTTAAAAISLAQAQAQQATSASASPDPILVSPPVAAHPPQDQAFQAPALQTAISDISAIPASAPGPRASTSRATDTQQATPAPAPAPNSNVILGAAPLFAARPEIKLEVPTTSNALDTESSPPPSPSPVSDILWRLHDVFHNASGPAMYRLSDNDEVYLTELTRGYYKKFFGRVAEIKLRDC